MVIIRNTDDPRARVDQVRRGTVREPLVVAEENDRVLPTKSCKGLRLVGGNGLGVTQPANLASAGEGRLIGAQAQGLDRTRRGIHALSGDLRAVVQSDSGHPIGPHLKATNPTLHASLDAMLAATIDE